MSNHSDRKPPPPPSRSSNPRTLREVYAGIVSNPPGALRLYNIFRQRIVNTHDEIDPNSRSLVSYAAMEEGEACRFLFANVIESWIKENEDVFDEFVALDPDIDADMIRNLGLGWHLIDLKGVRAAFLDAEIVWEDQVLAASLEDIEEEAEGSQAQQAEGLEERGGSDEVDDHDVASVLSEGNESETESEVMSDTSETETSSTWLPSFFSRFAFPTFTLPGPGQILARFFSILSATWNSEEAAGHRAWFIRCWQITFSILGYFDFVRKWAVRILLIWTPCGFFIYLLCSILWDAIESVPFIGPIAIVILPKFPRLFSSFSSAGFNSSLPQPNRTTDDLSTVVQPITFQGIDNAINATMRLSGLGIQMLPVAAILQYSARSLVGASDIVAASDVYKKAELGPAYESVKNDAGELGDTLKRYDTKVRTMIDELETSLNDTLIQVESQIELLQDPHRLPKFIYITSMTVSTACLVLSPYFSTLTSVHVIPCAASLSVVLQSDCVLRPAYGSSDYFWCPVIRRWYFRVVDEGSADATKAADTIASQFYAIYQILGINHNEILAVVDKGMEQAEKVDAGFSKVNRLRMANENKVQQEIEDLQIAANEPAGWGGWFKGSPTVGLTLSDKKLYSSLKGQVSQLVQLGQAHRAAHAQFTIAISILDEMKTIQEDFGRAVARVKTMSSRNSRDWQIMKNEIHRMRVLVKELQAQGRFSGGERKRLTAFARMAFLECVTREKETDGALGWGKGTKWDDCFFKRFEGGEE